MEMDDEKEMLFRKLQAEIDQSILEKMRGNNNDNMVRLHGES